MIVAELAVEVFEILSVAATEMAVLLLFEIENKIRFKDDV